MNVSPTLVRTVGHAWMEFMVSRACVQVRTLAHFAKVRKLACRVFSFLNFSISKGVFNIVVTV